MVWINPSPSWLRVLSNFGGLKFRQLALKLLAILLLVILFLATAVLMDGHDDHHHDPEDPCGHHSHAMVFHSCVCAEILFNGWATKNAVQLFGSAVAIFVAAVLYEGFKCLREELAQKRVALGESQMNIAGNEGGLKHTSVSKAMLNSGHALQTLMHLVQSTVSYMLMLIFMTYNVWLCLALVLGLTFGYFLFGWRRTGAVNDRNEHCQ